MNLPKPRAPQLLGCNATVFIGGAPSGSNGTNAGTDDRASGSRAEQPTMLLFLTDAAYAKRLASDMIKWVLNQIPLRQPALQFTDTMALFAWFSDEIVKIPNQGYPSAHHMAVFVIAYLIDTFDEIYDMFTDPKNEHFAIVSPERMKTFGAHVKVCITNFLSFSVTDTNAFYTLLTGPGI